MKDLTVIFLTENKLPKIWEKFHRKTLITAIRGANLITISREPMDFGLNILQTEPRSMSNIYWQLLKGAKLAKTKYVAVAEDDTLYCDEHFKNRPKPGTFAYNMCHWSLFTWGEPIYSWRNRKGNYSMIAERDLLIEALEERYAKWPKGTPDNRTGELGREMVERNLGTKHYDVSEFFTTIAIVNINHDCATDRLQLNHRKRHGLLRAIDIPYWGKAENILKNFK